MDDKQLTLEERNKCFNAFIEEYKTKNLKEKQKLIIDDLKVIIALFQQLCNDYKIKSDLLFNREIVNINKDNYTEDDFAEAVYTYIQMMKEVMSTFLIPMIEDDED